MFHSKTLSRIATAKIRKTLETTLSNIKLKKSKSPILDLKSKTNKRTETANNFISSHSLKMKIISIYSKTFNPKETKLFLSKEKIRAKLLKLLSNSIILNEDEIKEYKAQFNTKKQIKKRKKIKLTEYNNSMHFTSPQNIFSNPNYIYRYEDIYETPMEFIKKNFSKEEIQIMIHDPIYFHLDKSPLRNANLKLHFSLTSKIDFEDEIKDKNKVIEMFNIPKNNLDSKKIQRINSDSNIDCKNNNYLNFNFNFNKITLSNLNSLKTIKSRNEKKLNNISALPFTNVNKKIIISNNNQNYNHKNNLKEIVKKNKIKYKNYQNTFKDYENRKKNYLNDRQYERNKKYFILDKMNYIQMQKIQKSIENKNIIRTTINNLERVYSKKKIL